MDDTKDKEIEAKPTGISLYDAQREWLKKKAKELEAKRGKKVSASQVVQELIEEKIRKER